MIESQNFVSSDEVRNLILQTKQIASAYYAATERRLGVTGEIAEFEAANKLGLQLVKAGMRGYDALDSEGRKVQIKGRWRPTCKPYRKVPRIEPQADFDVFVYVLLAGEGYEPFQIWSTSKEAIVNALDGKVSAKGKVERITFNHFSDFAELAWQRQI